MPEEPTFGMQVSINGTNAGHVLIPVCSICGAAVPVASQPTHRDWHLTLFSHEEAQDA
jgi:hypothetical protein